MKIGYVCTSYNNSHFTVDAARSLAANAGHDVAVVVVDNSSTKAEQRILSNLERELPQVSVIFSEENVGYFRGLNLGMARLRRDRPDIDWMIVGNNDLEFPADFGDKLASNVGRWREFPVVSPDVFTVDGQHQNPHVISGISKAREIFYDLYYSNYHLGRLIHATANRFRGLSDRKDEESWHIAQSIYQGHGSVYLIGPRFFEIFAELWAPTFMMSEEYFLSKQLSDAGYQVYYDPAVQVIHHWHASLANLPTRRRWELARDAHREYRRYVKIWG
jgi:GT2 family glycosyltransferase